MILTLKPKDEHHSQLNGCLFPMRKKKKEVVNAIHEVQTNMLFLKWFCKKPQRIVEKIQGEKR